MTHLPLKLSVLSLSIALALGCAVAAEPVASTVQQQLQLPVGVKFVREVEGISEYQLGNGLTLLLIPDASKPSTTVNITYRVGSRYESYGETGMAHLLEHLMFKGSKAHPRLWEEMSQHGVEFNATTWLDRTNYFESFAAKPETLTWALAMEADRMVNSRISGDDLKTEFSVVRNEMEMGENSPTNILMERVISAAYEWHNYGKSTIGARTDVENVNIPHLQAFWRKYYQPDNATLIVAGAFDQQHVLKLVAADFGEIPRPSRVLETTYTLDPVQDGEREVTVRRVGDSQAVMALYHTVPAAHPDYPATEALALILGDTPNGRLHKALVETKKATEVYPWAASLEEPGFLLLGANLRSEQNVDEVKNLLIATVEGVHSNPIRQEELDRAKAKLDADIAQVFNDQNKFSISLSENIANGDWRLFFLFRDRVRALKLADVQRVADTWLKSSNRTVGRYIAEAKPERVPAPAKVAVAEQIQQFVPGKALAQAENFISTPENIDKRTQRGQFSNGLKYAFLPKTTRGSTVVVRMSLHLGDLASLTGRALQGEQAAAMLTRGTEALTRQQFSQELDQLKSKLAISGNNSGINVEIETVKDSLPRMLELLHDALRKPAFSEAEFAQYLSQNLAQLEEASKDPQTIAGDVLEKKLNTWPAGDPRYYFSVAEQIQLFKTVRLQDVKDFWAQFSGANAGEITLIGDFDPSAVKVQLEKQFADWNAKQAYQRIADPYQANPAGQVNEITPDKANAVFLASQSVAISDHDPDYIALKLGNYLLGGSANCRIINRIRQQDGVSYGGGSSFNADSLDQRGSFQIYAIFAPQNKAKLETGIREEVEKVLAKGFTTAEVEDGKRSFIQQSQLARSQDANLAGRLNRNLYLSRDMQFTAEQEKQILALTPEAIQRALVKYLDYSKLTIVAAGDFK